MPAKSPAEQSFMDMIRAKKGGPKQPGTDKPAKMAKKASPVVVMAILSTLDKLAAKKDISVRDPDVVNAPTAPASAPTEAAADQDKTKPAPEVPADVKPADSPQVQTTDSTKVAELLKWSELHPLDQEYLRGIAAACTSVGVNPAELIGAGLAKAAQATNAAPSRASALLKALGAKAKGVASSTIGQTAKQTWNESPTLRNEMLKGINPARAQQTASSVTNAASNVKGLFKGSQAASPTLGDAAGGGALAGGSLGSVGGLMLSPATAAAGAIIAALRERRRAEREGRDPRMGRSALLGAGTGAIAAPLLGALMGAGGGAAAGMGDWGVGKYEDLFGQSAAAGTNPATATGGIGPQ